MRYFSSEDQWNFQSRNIPKLFRMLRVFLSVSKFAFAECEWTPSVNKIVSAEDLEEIMGSRVVGVYVLLSAAFKGQRKGNARYLRNFSQDNNLNIK